MNSPEWNAGYDAFEAGKMSSCCPFNDVRRRSEWMAGFNQARMNKTW